VPLVPLAEDTGPVTVAIELLAAHGCALPNFVPATRKFRNL
jgi:hypothetical protein